MALKSVERKDIYITFSEIDICTYIFLKIKIILIKNKQILSKNSSLWNFLMIKTRNTDNILFYSIIVALTSYDIPKRG